MPEARDSGLADAVAGRRYADASQVDSPYARYVLFILVLIYMFNFVDRQILAILANDIKADLGVTDAEIGFLYGTAFAVFYAIFGIPLGRLSDLWVRKNVIAIGLGFWSLMTALSGTARSFGMLALCRFGVGVGEASSGPSAVSLLADYFRPARRATAMAIYASGIYIGSGVAYVVGGPVLDGWNNAFPDPATAPLHLRGWQVAFMAVGIPGILMSFVVWRLLEPLRGMSDGRIKAVQQHPHPFRETGKELLAILPGVNLLYLVVNRAGWRAVMWNMLAAALILSAGFGLYLWLGSKYQWIALGLGLYCAFTWSQSLALKNPEVFHTIFGSPTIVLCIIAFPLIALVNYGTGFWVIPYVLRAHEVSATEVGLVMGTTSVVAGLLGVSIGGWLADRLRERFEAGRLYVGVLCALGALPSGLAIMYVDSLWAVYALYFVFVLFKPMFSGPGFATTSDLVLPHMRGTMTAIYLLSLTFIGLALGPYMMGVISTRLSQGGMDPVEALRMGVIAPFGFYAAAVVLLLFACRTIKRDHLRIKDLASRD